MPRRTGQQLRWLRLAVPALLLLAVPAVPAATRVPCPVGTTTGTWQELPVRGWPQVPGVTATQQVTQLAVDPTDARKVLVTDGTSVLQSDASGCGFHPVLALEAVPDPSVGVSGTSATIVDLGVDGTGRVWALLRDTTAGVRPRVLTSPTGEGGTWVSQDAGLPPAAEPDRLVVGRETAYVTVRSAGPAESVLGPSSPGGVYAATAGGTWTSRPTGAEALQPFDDLAVDPTDDAQLWAVVGGHLLRSTDGGATFATLPQAEREEAGYSFTHVLAPAHDAVVAVAGSSADGPYLLRSTDAGATVLAHPVVGGVVRLASRGGVEEVLVESLGASSPQLRLVSTSTGRAQLVTPRTGSTGFDAVGAGGSYLVRTAKSLLRYVDPVDRGQVAPPVGEIQHGSVPPPLSARLEPSSYDVVLPAGATRTVRYLLALPRSRAPLDAYVVVDTSASMEPAISDLRAGLDAAAAALVADGTDVEMGLGTIGTAEASGAQDPAVSPTDRGYRKPALYTRLAPIGPLANLPAALDRLQVETAPKGERLEGQWVALEQLVTGRGVRRDPDLPLYDVAPGQTADWRTDERVRRVVVVATDGAFDNPVGTSRKSNGTVDEEYLTGLLRADRVAVMGLSLDFPSAEADLGAVAEATGALVPGADVDCGDAHRARHGRPLVCGNRTDFSDALLRMLRAWSRAPEPVTLSVTGAAALVGPAHQDVDLTDAATVPVDVTLSCANRAPGTYTGTIGAEVRGRDAARATAVLRCLPAAAAVAPDPVAERPAQPDPPSNPLVPAPAPAAPGQPPNPQPGNVPQLGTVAERQHQAQLALALQERDPEPDDVPEPVDVDLTQLSASRPRDEDAALALLLTGAVAVAGAVALETRRRRAAVPVVRAVRALQDPLD